MKKVVHILLACLVSTAAVAQATWTADKAHSQISFGIMHLGIAEIEGNFHDFDITAIASKDDLSDADFMVTIDPSSIDTGVERRDNHLRSADFFNVENQPEMVFESTSIKRISQDRYEITGELTLNGVTKPITLEGWYRGSTVHPQTKETIAGFKVTGTIQRSDFNLGSGFPAPMLSDEVTIEVDAELKKAQ